MLTFGVGRLAVNPNGGNQATNPTPLQLLTIQEVSVDISVEMKSLIGQMQYPDDVAPASKKITGKFTIGKFDIDLFNQIFFADTRATGIKATAWDEAQNVPATPGPYTVTVTHSATFGVDLGVRYANSATGGYFTKVASAPAQGQYSVAAGVYTFAAADQAVPVLISYTYTPAPNTAGKTLTANNQLMGYGPTFELWLADMYKVQGDSTTTPNGLHLMACRVSKVNFPRKNTDYLKIEVDFEAFANSSGVVMEMFQVSN